MEILTKLRPDRDLQCYFERPSAIAALSNAGPDAFTVSGNWRQQFDWAVVEWNRDNVFEHPAFRNLPDGDLSTVVLEYEESRTNCIPLDSNLFPTVEWDCLRVWASDAAGIERLYKVPLASHAVPVEGAYKCASATFRMTGAIRPGDYIGLAFLGEHHTRQVYFDDTIAGIVRDIARDINGYSQSMIAEYSEDTIRLIYVGQSGPGIRAAEQESRTGANGNRVGAYGHVTPGSTLNWERQFATFEGGESPRAWKIRLEFAHLMTSAGETVPTTAVRKMRWTYAADLQTSAFQRSEFVVQVRNWHVTGDNLTYLVAGPGSRRVEDDSECVSCSGPWTRYPGNFSGGSILHTTRAGSRVEVTYEAPVDHTLLVGTRLCSGGAAIDVEIDGTRYARRETGLEGEDVLSRCKLSEVRAGRHTVVLTHAGPEGSSFYFDFIEAAVLTSGLPQFPAHDNVTLATDWDTDHSIAIAPERTAWLIESLGFRGRGNHYVGAMWFYDLQCEGNDYASATVRFTGQPAMSAITALTICKNGTRESRLEHLNLAGDTAETVALSFALEINRGYTGIRAEAQGDSLRISSRVMGTDGNVLSVAAEPGDGAFRVEPADAPFAGGVDGCWRTDLNAVPRINRAARDWTVSFVRAMTAVGIASTVGFSMELQHGPEEAEVGIAQRYPDGKAVMLSTPALQTNFSDVSRRYWREVYREAARLMENAGTAPYLQFGEVQWWYFPNDSGMTFYDAYTRSRFLAEQGREMKVIKSPDEDPHTYEEELDFVANLLGEFTEGVMAWVRSDLPECRFEVLFPPDVNEPQLSKTANYPPAQWTPQTLSCLKTENFTYTYSRDLDRCKSSMQTGIAKGFTAQARSHLVGISDPMSPWMKEVELALSEGVESVVLFALDQFCLIGYDPQFGPDRGRSARMG